MDTANPGDPAVQAEATHRRTGRIPADTFSIRLMLARALAGHLSIREASELTGLNRGAWQDWEHGRRPRDLIDVCRRVADKLDVDFNWLLLGGSLAGPRGVPTERPTRDTHGYAAMAVRTMPGEPNDRPRTWHPQTGRRAVRVELPVAA
jgi:transcriptional regulator with XRE-family HTH domain